MLVTMLASALALSSTPAPAVERVRLHIAQADYVRSVDPKGNVRLQGQYRPSGEQFSFRVYADGTVRGWVGVEPVKFRLSDIKQRTE